jgi:outer membrane protein
VKINVFVGSALAVALTLGAQAQTGKVAVINIQGAIINTKDGQKAAQELDAKAAPKKKEIEGKQSEITGLQDQLTKGQNTLSDATKNDLYKNIESKKKSLQRDVEDAQAELDQDQQKVLQQLGQKMMAVIERYARDNGYTMVVDISSPQTPVLYASPSIDITKEIIDLYDKSTASMSAPAKTAAPSTGGAPALSNPTPATKNPPATPGTPASKPPAAPPGKQTPPPGKQ